MNRGLLIELVGLTLIAWGAYLVDWRFLPVVFGLYLIYVARSM